VSENLDMAVANTDRELWRESPDFYADSIHATETGGIGISVGGHVVVRTLTQWHAMAAEIERLRAENATFAVWVVDSAVSPESVAGCFVGMAETPARSDCRPDERDMV
jgi:hypothetical protein